MNASAKVDDIIEKLSDNLVQYNSGTGNGAKLLDQKAKLQAELKQVTEQAADEAGQAALDEIKSLITELAAIPKQVEQATAAKRQLEQDILDLEAKLPKLVQQQQKARDTEASLIRRKVAIKKMFQAGQIDPDNQKSWQLYRASKIAQSREQSRYKASIRLKETETAMAAERSAILLTQ